MKNTKYRGLVPFPGTRSRTGSENIAIFTSLNQTAKLQGGSVLHLLQQLICGTLYSAAEALFRRQ